LLKIVTAIKTAAVKVRRGIAGVGLRAFPAHAGKSFRRSRLKLGYGGAIVRALHVCGSTGKLI
jgi:hypothetical protein